MFTNGLQSVWKILEHKVAFTIFYKVVKVVDNIFMLDFFVKLVLSLLLFMVFTHFYCNQFFR